MQCKLARNGHMKWYIWIFQLHQTFEEMPIHLDASIGHIIQCTGVLYVTTWQAWLQVLQGAAEGRDDIRIHDSSHTWSNLLALAAAPLDLMASTDTCSCDPPRTSSTRAGTIDPLCPACSAWASDRQHTGLIALHATPIAWVQDAINRSQSCLDPAFLTVVSSGSCRSSSIIAD
jgi:hypothetical protein